MSARRHAEQGFSLVELMIALLLGLMVIGSATAIFLSNKESYRTGAALSRVQENSRVAFEMLTRDLRQARLTGCGNDGTTANLLNSNTTTWYTDFANRGLVGFSGDDADDNPALTTGTASGNHVTETDSVTLIGASDVPYSVDDFDQSTNLITVSETNPTLSIGDLVVVCDTEQADIAQITGTTGGFTIATGSGTPGNSSALSKEYKRNATISQLKSATWYIGCNPLPLNCDPDDGGTSLFRIVAVGATGPAVTTQVQEIVRGVSNMDLLYHVSGATDFVEAEDVASWAADQIDAIRIRLRMVGTDQRGGTPIAREQTTIVSLRNPPI